LPKFIQGGPEIISKSTANSFIHINNNI